MEEAFTGTVLGAFGSMVGLCVTGGTSEIMECVGVKISNKTLGGLLLGGGCVGASGGAFIGVMHSDELWNDGEAEAENFHFP